MHDTDVADAYAYEHPGNPLQLESTLRDVVNARYTSASLEVLSRKSTTKTVEGDLVSLILLSTIKSERPTLTPD